jgi:mycothiol synthase
MVGSLAPVPVDPATASADFWNRYHELRRVRQMEARPDDPVRPDDVEERRMKRANAFQVEHRYEISSDGLMWSSFYGNTVRPGTLEYESNRHLFWADFYVRPDHRRRRIGSSWLPLILELMDLHGCTKVGMGTEEPAGHKFMRWLGADEGLTGAENRLDLARVDWTMVEGWAAQGAARSPGTALEIYDGPIPEAMWAEFAPQLAAMLKTIPMENLDIGQIIVTPDHMRDLNDRLETNGEQQHTLLVREPDGVILGVTEVTWAPYRAAIVQQQFTGVRVDARGRGLGKWIKAAMLLHLREVYPEVRWITTDNSGSNAPMLAINKQLGFRQYRASTEYQMDRDRLAARIEQLSL